MARLLVAIAARAMLVGMLLLSQACVYLDETSRPTPTSLKPVAAAAPTRGTPTRTPVPTATRTPATRTPTPQPADETDIEQSVADARARLEGVLGGAALLGLEDMLGENVALAAPTGGDHLARSAAAKWLRQRATGRIRVVEFQRHQHQALIIASTQGWAALASSSSNELEFTLRRYDAAGAQDPEHGTWLIDVIEAE
jgi:hypothetical protein